MKRLVRWPRVICFSVLGVLAVAGVAVGYPGGLVALFEDFRDSKELNDRMADGKRTNERHMAVAARLRDRMEYKQELVSALVRGDESLAEVSERFADLHHHDDHYLWVQQTRFGQLPEAELAACNVLGYVSAHTPCGEGTSPVWTRLRAEFEQRFGHPAPKFA